MESNNQPEIYRRIMSYAGKRRNQVTAPNVTANEAIVLADHISLLIGEAEILKSRVEVLHNLIFSLKQNPDYYIVKTFDETGQIEDKCYKDIDIANKMKSSRECTFKLKTEVLPVSII